jgi:hypothetical protein
VFSGFDDIKLSLFNNATASFETQKTALVAPTTAATLYERILLPKACQQHLLWPGKSGSKWLGSAAKVIL